MPSYLRAGALAGLLAAGLAANPDPAAAQGFFESLFGFGAKPASAVPRVPHPAIQDYRTKPYIPERASTLRDEGASPDDDQPSKSGRYRTLCVRMCDGFYWPISGAASRSALHRDADLCRNSCGTEARLFFHDKGSPDANAMVDLTGRAYTRLPVAFLYRKNLVSGCSCKPEPWTQSELDRHRQYAAEAAVTKSDEQQTVPDATGAGHRASPDALRIAATSNAEPQKVAAEQEAPAAANDRAEAKAAPLIPLTQRPARRASRTLIRTALKSPAPAKPRPQLARTNRNPAPAGIFGLGAKPSRWPGD